jgi:D-alanyl-D-alanine carboxypeptidase
MKGSIKTRIHLLTALIIGVFLLTACGALDKAQVTAVESIASAIPANSWDELLQNFTEDLLCAAPGAVLLVDAPDGRFLKSIGVSSVEDQTPLQVSDAFEIGSNTKSFTVVLALQLQENGVWSLDDPLSNWLPDVAAQIPNGDEVTLRQMAGNTSGIWDYANPLLGAGVTDESLRQKTYTPEEIVAYAPILCC